MLDASSDFQDKSRMPPPEAPGQAPDQPLRRNAFLFILFRVGFNTRFYYPVFSVLFLDLGLSLEQFSILNSIWAASIVALEIPSGTWADRSGRKPFLVTAGVLMILEMLTFIFAPAGRVGLLFPFLCANRVLSGMGEAFASGADEALAYESLIATGQESAWPQVLARLMRWQSVSMFAAMLVGAAAYDSALLNTTLHALGWHGAHLTAKEVIRFPVYMTLGSAFLTLAAASLMAEPPRSSHAGIEPSSDSTWARIVDAGRWILTQRFVLTVILAGLALDSVSRLFFTMASNYLRLVGIAARYFGLILASLTLLGAVAAPAAKWLAVKRSPGFNFLLLAAIVWLALLGVGGVFHLAGALFLFPLGFIMQFEQFFLSHYLNASVESSRRSTVLSFKGSTLNAGYGFIGLLYAGLTSYLAASHPHLAKDQVFGRSLLYLPWYFLATAAAVVWLGSRGAGNKRSWIKPQASSV